MDAQIASAVTWFRQIYLDGVPVLLEDNKTSFLSFVCTVSAIDAVAGYRYPTGSEARFKQFLLDYFPLQYAAHAARLYVFRCRMLHNFSPAHFSLVHASPASHLHPSDIDTYLDDATFFADMRAAAEKYFAELQSSAALQSQALNRLNNLATGGGIWAQP